MDGFQFFDSLERYNLVLIKQKIFSYLDFKSLHRSRQVCKDWHSFILEEALKSRGSPNAVKTLKDCWSCGSYSKTTIECPKDSGFYICADEESVGIGTKHLKTLVVDIATGQQILSLRSEENQEEEPL